MFQWMKGRGRESKRETAAGGVPGRCAILASLELQSWTSQGHRHSKQDFRTRNESSNYRIQTVTSITSISVAFRGEKRSAYLETIITGNSFHLEYFWLAVCGQIMSFHHRNRFSTSLVKTYNLWRTFIFKRWTTPVTLLSSKNETNSSKISITHQHPR